MKHRHSTAGRPSKHIQQAHLSVMLGQRMHLAVDVRVTPGIGGLVSAILLSTAALVHTARRPA